MADLPRAMVRTAGDTTIPGADITSPACPLNGCIDVGVGAVGSPGSPFWPFIPGVQGAPDTQGIPVVLVVLSFPEVPAHRSGFC